MLFADETGKFRVFDNESEGQKKVILSPEYGGIISKMAVFTSSKGDSCLAFAGQGKVVGLGNARCCA